MVPVWGWSLRCAPRLSQCHPRELPGASWTQPGIAAEPRPCSPEGILLSLASWWQNPRRNQGWAVPGAAPSAARWESWAEGFGVISVGLGSAGPCTEGGDSRSPSELGVQGIWSSLGLGNENRAEFGTELVDPERGQKPWEKKDKAQGFQRCPSLPFPPESWRDPKGIHGAREAGQQQGLG